MLGILPLPYPDSCQLTTDLHDVVCGIIGPIFNLLYLGPDGWGHEMKSLSEYHWIHIYLTACNTPVHCYRQQDNDTPMITHPPD